MVALESYVNLPDVTAWDVKFCCLGIIAEAADPDCEFEVVAGNSNCNSILLRWESLRENTFYTNLTTKTRQPAVQSLIWNIYCL